MMMMASSFHHFVAYVAYHPYLGMLVAFLIAFTESLPLIGTIVPGSITMTALGTLIGAKALPFEWTLFWASLGALLGDAIGYYLGKYADHWIRQMWPFNKHPTWLAKGEHYFHQHGGKSIIIGRFVGPVRSTIPLVAGLLKLSTPRFIMAAIPSAITWAFAYTLPGILLGALSIDLNPHAATEFVLVGILIIAFLWLLFWLSFRTGRYILKKINHGIMNLWKKSAHKQHRYYQLLKRKHHESDHHQLTLFVLAFLSLCSFFLVLANVISHGPLLLLNRPTYFFLQSIHTSWLTHFLVVFTLLGDKVVIFGFALLMIVWLSWQKHWRAASYLFSVTLFSALSIGAIKHLYHFPRPSGLQHVATSSSFPSGHTGFGLVVLGFTAYLGGLLAEKKWRQVHYVVISILITLIAFSRLYLGAHWLSDILGSLTLGFAILLTGILLHRRYLQVTKPIQPWLTAILLALLVPWVTYGSLMYDQTLNDYQTQSTPITTSITHWWNYPTQVAPIYHDNRFGKPYSPFNVQWLESKDTIVLTLKKAGWITMANPLLSLQYNLKRLTHDNPAQHLPFLPRQYGGKTAEMIFFLKTTDPHTLLQLTLWPAQVKFLDNDTPLWIGTLQYHQSQAPNLLHYHKQHYLLSPKGSLEKLLSALPQFQYRIIEIPLETQPEFAQKQHWDGHIIVIKSH